MLGVGEFAMRGGPRMARERLDAAKADGVATDLQASQKIEGGGFAAVQFQRHQRAGIIGLRVANSDLFEIAE